MALYALVNALHQIDDYRDSATIPPEQIAGSGPKAGWRWLPVVDQASNTSTLNPELTTTTVSIGALDANSTQVVRTTATVNLAGAELTAAKAAMANGLTYREFQLLKMMCEVLFDLKKSVTPGTTIAQFSTFAQGLNAITDNQFRTFIQNKL